ncbi:hypothetical protein [Rothia aerolata]|uniref:Pilus assembly protein TadE n=1 Tax=Rothia aerolata TaxID=1812262 RepID=A0A917IQ46_9MICC|nr:hypothetical protein [Rothia aerolata]GGH59405.1 hypothetical protein GCM10007359_06560 [Rothia aerolata]
MTTRENQAESSETGSAMIEFLGLGLMLMIPTVYFLLAIFSLQSGAMAAIAASQQAIQVIENSPRSAISNSSVQRSAAFAAADYGFAPEQVAATVSCTGDCTEESALRVDVAISVNIPLIPGMNNQEMAEMTSSATAWGGKYR